MNQEPRRAEHAIVIYGKSSVGKTTLLKNLLEYFNCRILNEPDSFEIGPDLRGGPFHHLFTLDCERTEMALIVYDVTRPKTFFKVKEYLDKITKRCPQLPVIIVANKIDLDTRIVPQEAGTMLAKAFNVCHYEISADTKKGIQVLVEKEFNS